MDSSASVRLEAVALAMERFPSPAELRARLRNEDIVSISMGWTPTSAQVSRAVATAARLAETRIGVVALGDDEYPRQLLDLGAPPPLLFYVGNLDLIHARAIGICGSRDASGAGLAAARACGTLAAREGLTVISGYAKGVDTEAHLGALDTSGTTVAVLAEGILQFRWKRAFEDRRADDVLVLSQFHPAQSWNAGAAMTRNALIVALGTALVVIEARETGGTLDAGLKAIALDRPVLALEFASGTPRGNATLIERGAYRVASPAALSRVLHAIEQGGHRGQLQLTL